MVKKLFNVMLFSCLLLFSGLLKAQNGIKFDKYHKQTEVLEILKQLNQNNSTVTSLHTIATSQGGVPVTILEIGKNLKDVPAIFVGANFEGNVPISTEGAIYLAKMILDSVQYAQKIKWYILPLPNPEGANDFFAAVKTGNGLNTFEINNDADELLNEDGCEDLNKDGFITQMRVKDLQGTYVVSKNDARILERASSKKGERGVYKTYDEGIDNDKDGKYNEDGAGGINVGIAFPHLFPKDKKEAGLYPGQTPEVYGIMRFIFNHPEISMVYTLGSSNFCAVPPKGGRKGGANMEQIKIPSRYARMFGVDASKTYTMDEVIALMQPRVPAGMELTPSMVAGFLGLGAAVNPLDDDLVFYKKFADDYKKFLEKQNVNTETLGPSPAKDGSFELWAYYHLGVPSFSMNLFTVPKVKEDKKKDEKVVSLEEVEKMTADEFIALGEEKIDAFLKANNAPDRFKAKGIMEMMGSGNFAPKQMVGMMKQMPKPEKEGELSEKDKALLAWSEKHWDGKGFVSWTKVEHPDFEEAEVGGYVPYLESTPKPELIDSLAKTQLPWLLQLTKQLPEINIVDQKVTDLGAGVYRLELFVENKSYLPYPIAMGQRNRQPAPFVVLIEGNVELLEGVKRTPLGSMGGNQVKKMSWVLKSDKKASLTAKIESAVFTDIVKQINIGG